MAELFTDYCFWCTKYQLNTVMSDSREEDRQCEEEEGQDDKEEEGRDDKEEG